MYLKRGGAVEFGGVGGVWRNVGDVGDKLLQIMAALLQVSGVNDHLDQLRTDKHKTETDQKLFQKIEQQSKTEKEKTSSCDYKGKILQKHCYGKNVKH